MTIRCQGKNEGMNKDEALKHLNIMITFVSCMAFRKEVLAGADYSNKVGTNLLQSYVFMDALSIGNNFLIINEPCVAMRANDAIGYKLTDVFITNFKSLMDYAGQIGYSKSTIREVLKKDLIFIIGCIKHFKVSSADCNRRERTVV